MSRGRAGERGSATLFAVACLSLLMVLGAALGVVAGMVHAHRQAQSAADLAALAGAQAAARGRDPCTAAGSVATANDARLTDCRVAGSDVLVEVDVVGPRWLGQEGDLSGQARAGPG